MASTPQATATPVAPSGGNSITNAAMWCHLGALLAGAAGFLVFVTVFLTWLPALLIRQKYPNEPFIQRHAKESMNFQIQWLILFIPMVIVSLITFGIGFIAMVALGIWQIVVMIQASMAASRGEEYSYKLTFIRVIK